MLLHITKLDTLFMAGLLPSLWYCSLHAAQTCCRPGTCQIIAEASFGTGRSSMSHCQCQLVKIHSDLSRPGLVRRCLGEGPACTCFNSSKEQLQRAKSRLTDTRTNKEGINIIKVLSNRWWSRLGVTSVVPAGRPPT